MTISQAAQDDKAFPDDWTEAEARLLPYLVLKAEAGGSHAR